MEIVIVLLLIGMAAHAAFRSGKHTGSQSGFAAGRRRGSRRRYR